MLMSEKIELVLNAANDVVHLITHDIAVRRVASFGNKCKLRAI